MKQKPWAAAAGFAGACLIDRLDLTEPSVPTCVRPRGQQPQLQGWEHRRVLCAAGGHAAAVPRGQSRSALCSPSGRLRLRGKHI